MTNMSLWCWIFLDNGSRWKTKVESYSFNAIEQKNNVFNLENYNLQLSIARRLPTNLQLFLLPRGPGTGAVRNSTLRGVGGSEEGATVFWIRRFPSWATSRTTEQPLVRFLPQSGKAGRGNQGQDSGTDGHQQGKIVGELLLDRPLETLCPFLYASLHLHTRVCPSVSP